ncbi:MAG: NAD(P)/FAD-dependent oxidoreductase [Neisseriaceae bacterium]
MINIAVIGSGLSGLTIAEMLKNYANITIFEKARGVGGRMSTRRSENFTFDHGAQYFTVNTKEFNTFIEPMVKIGIVQSWNPKLVKFENNKIIDRSIYGQDQPYYVAVPGMNALVKYLSNNLELRLNTKVGSIIHNKYWDLFDENNKFLGSFDWVISTAPPIQTIELMPDTYKYSAEINAITMDSCFVLMLGFKDSLPLDFDVALIDNANISSISVNSSKPGRSNSFSLVVNSTNKWAEYHLEQNREDLIQFLCNETSSIIGYNVNSAIYKDLHRWRYATNSIKQNNPIIMVDSLHKLAACGDWCINGDIESAFLSSCRLAKSILEII